MPRAMSTLARSTPAGAKTGEHRSRPECSYPMKEKSHGMKHSLLTDTPVDRRGDVGRRRARSRCLIPCLKRGPTRADLALFVRRPAHSDPEDLQEKKRRLGRGGSASHMREVAGSNPAAPTERPAKGWFPLARPRAWKAAPRSAARRSFGLVGSSQKRRDALPCDSEPFGDLLHGESLRVESAGLGPTHVCSAGVERD